MLASTVCGQIEGQHIYVDEGEEEAEDMVNWVRKPLTPVQVLGGKGSHERISC